MPSKRPGFFTGGFALGGGGCVAVGMTMVTGGGGVGAVAVGAVVVGAVVVVVLVGLPAVGGTPGRFAKGSAEATGCALSCAMGAALGWGAAVAGSAAVGVAATDVADVGGVASLVLLRSTMNPPAPIPTRSSAPIPTNIGVFDDFFAAKVPPHDCEGPFGASGEATTTGPLCEKPPLCAPLSAPLCASIVGWLG